MPQNPNKITKAFEEILKNRSNKDRVRINDARFFDSATENITGENPQTILTEGATIKSEIIKEMRSAIEILSKKNEISQEHFNNANAAIDFYDRNTNVLPWSPNPHGLLSELNAIDYSQKVKITRVKPGQLLTQMQPAYLEGQERVGNFYAPGSLPTDFNDRADKSGIGLKGVEKDGTHSSKSVYIGKVEKECIALRSTASPALDTWSVQGQNQMSQGGGIQLRMSSGDYGKVVRQEYGEVQAREHGEKDKSLKGGYLQPKKKDFRTEVSKERAKKHVIER